jgi:hypothetical protein
MSDSSPRIRFDGGSPDISIIGLGAIPDMGGGGAMFPNGII